jgi:hypothetical protein
MEECQNWKRKKKLQKTELRRATEKPTWNTLKKKIDEITELQRIGR